VIPSPLYIDVDGIGVSRHASQAASAQTLVDWLLRERTLSNSMSYDGSNIGLAGWRNEEAALLAERAGYR
jgi:hypothetical protein